jgi:hypothetical protein
MSKDSETDNLEFTPKPKKIYHKKIHSKGSDKVDEIEVESEEKD